MASMRASEIQEQTLERLEQKRTHVASMRASEIQEQTLERLEQKRTHVASMRASEIQEQTLERLEQNRMRITSMRASETSDVKLHKRRKNKEAMVNARIRTVLIESAIAAFHSEVKLGPEFVCTCCHRMMYRKSIVACNKVKYTKTSTDVLHKVFSPDYIH